MFCVHYWNLYKFRHVWVIKSSVKTTLLTNFHLFFRRAIWSTGLVHLLELLYFQNVKCYQDQKHEASFMIETNSSSSCMVRFMGLSNYTITDVYNGYFKFYSIVNDSDLITILETVNGKLNEWISVKILSGCHICT